MNTELIFERVMRRLLTEASNCDFKEITELSIEDQRFIWKKLQWGEKAQVRYGNTR